MNKCECAIRTEMASARFYYFLCFEMRFYNHKFFLLALPMSSSSSSSSFVHFCDCVYRTRKLTSCAVHLILWLHFLLRMGRWMEGGGHKLLFLIYFKNEKKSKQLIWQIFLWDRPWVPDQILISNVVQEQNPLTSEREGPQNILKHLLILKLILAIQK